MEALVGDPACPKAFTAPARLKAQQAVNSKPSVSAAHGEAGLARHRLRSRGAAHRQEILEHYNYRGQVMRVLFTHRIHRPSATLSAGEANAEYAPLYAAAVRAGRPTRSTTCR